MGQYLIESLIDDFAAEAVSHGNAELGRAPVGQVFKIGRQGPAQAHELGHPADEHLALIPAEEEAIGPAGPSEAQPQASKNGLTGSYSSRLFGASNGYFADKILKK